MNIQHTATSRPRPIRDAARVAAAARPRSATTPARLFAAQHGLASRRQLVAAGVTAATVERQLRLGEWRELSPGVLRLVGAPDEWQQAPMAVTLGTTRSAVTGPTCLRLRGLDGFTAADGLYVVSHQGDAPRLPAGAVLWRSRRLTADDVMLLDGIRCTIAPTALVHAAPVSDPTSFGKAVDDLLRRPGVSPAWVQRVAERWRGRGVPGSGILTAALAERCDRPLPRSWFERLARRALERHGYEFAHEVPVDDGGRRLAVLDLALLHLKIGVECQSWQWHSTPAARAANARRQRRLERLGWHIIELWWSDLDDLDEVLVDIAAAIERQNRLLSQ